MPNRIACIVIALAVLLVACGAPAPAAPARVEVAAAQTSTAVWRIVGKVGEWDVDLTIYQQSSVVATPSPTAPPATSTTPTDATPTQTLIPTNTLRPTATRTTTVTGVPSPTFTPTPTFTPDASPTPEMTPPPTPTGATAVPKVCELKVNRNINKRSGPGVTFAIVGSQAAGTNVRPIAFQVGGQYLWAQLDLRTWLVVRDMTAPGTWWVDGVDGEGVCEDVLGWPPGLGPPPAVALQVGLHILIGANEAPIFLTLPTWGVLKCLNGTEHICLEAKRRNPNLTIIFRALNTCQGMADGPQMAGWYNPSTWYGCIRGYWPEGFDYYEIINEVGPPGDDFALMAQFNIEVARLAAGDGKCILAFSFGPGNPEIAYWSDLLPYLLWANDHPCDPGRYHGVALHQSVYLPASVPLQKGDWVNSIWVAGRDWIIDGFLQLNHGFSLTQFKGPVYLTEIGLEDGYSGSWDDRWNCAQLALAIAETKDRLAARSWITGFTWWNVGGVAGGRWTDDGPCLGDMARALQ